MFTGLVVTLHYVRIRMTGISLPIQNKNKPCTFEYDYYLERQTTHDTINPNILPTCGTHPSGIEMSST